MPVTAVQVMIVQWRALYELQLVPRSDLLNGFLRSSIVAICLVVVVLICCFHNKPSTTLLVV